MDLAPISVGGGVDQIVAGIAENAARTVCKDKRIVPAGSMDTMDVDVVEWQAKIMERLVQKCQCQVELGLGDRYRSRWAAWDYL
ncbi:MAG: hypothetical protein JKP98_20905 [Rhodobacteraceae bacterium]|nr:hypothetical protein [Paracoccaceae bacterium]